MKMLTQCLLIVVLATLSVVTGTYVILFPNALIPGVPLQVRVLVQRTSDPVTVWASLKQNDFLVSENSSAVVQGELPTTLSLTVPGSLLPAQYKVFIKGSGGMNFENSSDIHFENESLSVYIVTDKTRYSAGQTVKYRAFLTLPNMLNFEGDATVTIKDGMDNKIEVNAPTLVTNGVISGEIELSEFPVFGRWSIVIDAMGKTTTQPFEVNDYVLPKFDVKVTIPENLNAEQESFTVNVTAVFTFNTGVIGNCTLSFYNVDKPWKNYELSEKLTGSARFTVQMSQINTQLDVKSKINIRAMVTDKATALTTLDERTLIIVLDTRVAITQVNPQKNSFIPRKTFRTKFFIGRNNQPIGQSGNLTIKRTVTNVVLISCNSYRSSNNRYKRREVTKITGESTLPYDETGYAELSYLEDSPNVEKIDFLIVFNDSNIQSDPSYLAIVVNALSKSAPALRINSNMVKTRVGESISIGVEATGTLRGHLNFEVYSLGMQRLSEQVTIDNVCCNTHIITMTKEMIPCAYIYVHHLTETGYLISDYIYIDVNGDPLRNEVNVSYNATHLQPGEAVTMHISADPYSTVYVSVKDEKNHILERNYVFKDDESESISKMDLQECASTPKVVILSDAKVIDKKFASQRNLEYPESCFDRPPLSIEWSSPKDVYMSIADRARALDDRLLVNSRGYENETNVDQRIVGLSLGEIVRSRFPETWIWEEHKTGETGEINITKIIPDSMTTWVTKVFAMNSHTGFGVADTKPEVTVKKMFFLTMDLPKSIVQGEEFILQINVFNNGGVQKEVDLRIILSEDPKNVIQVPANVTTATFILITPKLIGVLNITVEARPNVLSSPLSDIVKKSVTVRQKGIFRTCNRQHLLDVSSDDGPVTTKIELKDPKQMVKGTKSTIISITENFMVPSIDGLGNLIQMPYGCGEQTMLNFAPAIYITKYLQTVDRLTPEIEQKSTRSLKAGLQSELSYQHDDGSFSAFGQNKDQSGSTWLTAFILKCFGQASGLIKIDEGIMSKAMEWMLKHQKKNGAFNEPGKVIHTHMQGGTASGLRVTSFILISLLENRDKTAVKRRKLKKAINRAEKYLEARLYKATDSYTLAIVCYSLASAGRSDSEKTCYTKLRNAADFDDDKMYWHATKGIAKREVCDRSLVDKAPSEDIETSAYALLTYMKLGRTLEAYPIMKWLVFQRNPTGGYRSTQDTIIALQALSEFSRGLGSGPSENYSVLFEIMSFEGFSHKYSTNSTTFGIMHRIEVPDKVKEIMLRVSGTGTAMIDVTTSYYVTGSESDDYISVEAEVEKETLNAVKIKGCVRWTGPKQSGMLMMEVEMPTGFQPDNHYLEQQNNWIKRYETNGRKIALYFDGLSKGNGFCVYVPMYRKDRVVKNQPCHVTVFDYYDPAHQAITIYGFGVLNKPFTCFAWSPPYVGIMKKLDRMPLAERSVKNVDVRVCY